MAIKLLVSGFENTGKSTLVSTITDALVINMDRKEYGFAVPHINVTEFHGIDALISQINEKLGVYQDKFKKLPATVVIDTVTQFYTAMSAFNDNNYKGFDVHKNNNRDTLNLNAYVEDVLIANGINVVIVAHTVFDADTARHIIPATGQFGKSGSWLSITNDAVFIEKKSSSYVVHQKSMKFPCRTTLLGLEDSVDSTHYDINEHIAKLTASKVEATSFLL